jgi:hypothetical protein
MTNILQDYSSDPAIQILVSAKFIFSLRPLAVFTTGDFRVVDSLQPVELILK